MNAHARTIGAWITFEKISTREFPVRDLNYTSSLAFRLAPWEISCLPAGKKAVRRTEGGQER